MFFFLIPAKDEIEKYKKDPRQTYGFKQSISQNQKESE